MTRRMTVVFHDEALYTRLKVAAATQHKPASDIVADAVRDWLEDLEDAELLPVIDAARAEWKESGGRPWPDAEREIEEIVSGRQRTSGD